MSISLLTLYLFLVKGIPMISSWFGLRWFGFWWSRFRWSRFRWFVAAGYVCLTYILDNVAVRSVDKISAMTVGNPPLGGHLTFQILTLLRYVVYIGLNSQNPIFFLKFSTPYSQKMAVFAEKSHKLRFSTLRRKKPTWC